MLSSLLWYLIGIVAYALLSGVLATIAAIGIPRVLGTKRFSWPVGVFTFPLIFFLPIAFITRFPIDPPSARAVITLVAVDDSPRESEMQTQRNLLAERSWSETAPISVQLSGTNRIKVVANYADQEQLDRFCFLLTKKGGLQLAILAHPERDKAIIALEGEPSQPEVENVDGNTRGRWVWSLINPASDTKLPSPHFWRPNELISPADQILPPDIVSRPHGGGVDVLINEPVLSVDLEHDLVGKGYGFRQSGYITYSTLTMFEVAKDKLKALPTSGARKGDWLATIVSEELVGVSPVYGNLEYRRELISIHPDRAMNMDQIRWKPLPLQMIVASVATESADVRRRVDLAQAVFVVAGLIGSFLVAFFLLGRTRGLVIFAMHCVHAIAITIIVCQIIAIDKTELRGVTPYWNAIAISVGTLGLLSASVLSLQRFIFKDIRSRKAAWVYAVSVAAACTLLIGAVVASSGLGLLKGIASQNCAAILFLAALVAYWPLAFGSWSMLRIVAEPKSTPPR